MIGQRCARDALPYVLLAGVVAVSAVIPGAGLLGEWESSTIFSTFGVRENSLSLAIAKRGNVGGAGYAVLEVVRPLLERFDLQPTLMTLRLPVIACGMIALAFFFVLGKRCFGTWPSLGATALLAVNPIFSEFQHELIVVGPSLMAFIIFLERLQALSLRRELWRNWILFSLSLVLVFLLYGPGRILAVTIWMLWGLGWVIRFLSARDYQSLGKFGVKNFTSAIFIAFTLVGLSTTNVGFLGSRLLFPKNSENFLVSDSSVAPLTTIWLNARIVAESLILGGGANHSDTLELALSGGRFALIPIVVVPIYLAGLGISLWRIFKVRDPLRSPYSMIVVLVFLTTVPMVTSSVFESVAGSSTELLSSLSTYRLAYFLVPAYLAVAVAISWFSAAKVWVRSVVSVLVSVLFLTSASSIITSRSNFEREMSRVDPSLVSEAASAQWSSGRRQQGYSPIGASHLQQHLQYWRWASEALERIEITSAQDEVVVLSTSVSCFTEAPLKPQSLDFYDVNFHDVFLAVYLSELMPHISVAYTFLAPLDGERRGLVEKEGVYSAVLSEISPGLFDVETFDPEGSRIQSLNGSDAKVIIATTPKELDFVRNSLSDQKHKFLVIDMTGSCFSKEPND